MTWLKPTATPDNIERLLCGPGYLNSACAVVGSGPGANLVAGPLTISPTNPTSDDRVTISGSLTNVGEVLAGNFDWQIRLDGQDRAGGYVAALSAGTTIGPSTVRWEGRVPAGSHTSELIVDTRNAVWETNGEDNVRSQAFSVSTPPPPPGQAPTVRTTAAGSISWDSFWAHGDVYPNGLDTQWWVEWGTTPSVVHHASGDSIDSGTPMSSIGKRITGLEPGTLYYFRVVAANSAGTTRGAVFPVTTLP